MITGIFVSDGNDLEERGKSIMQERGSTLFVLIVKRGWY